MVNALCGGTNRTDKISFLRDLESKQSFGITRIRNNQFHLMTVEAT